MGYRHVTTGDSATTSSPDWVQMVQCLIFLDDPNTVAAVLEELSQGTQDDALMAYQIAFDLYESATQQFLNNVVQAVRKTAPIPIAIATGGLSSKDKSKDSEKDAKADEKTEETMEVEQAPDTKEDKGSTGEEGGESTEEKGETKVTTLSDLAPEQRAQQSNVEKLTKILSGDTTIF